MQEQARAVVIGYGIRPRWREGVAGWAINRVLTITLTVAIAYALPLAVYATWAWLRLRPRTWPNAEAPQVDPLGLAWQYWHPTGSESIGGSSYWAAVEQGERWWLAALCSSGVFVFAIVILIFRAFLTGDSGQNQRLCNFDPLSGSGGLMIRLFIRCSVVTILLFAGGCGCGDTIATRAVHIVESSGISADTGRYKAFQIDTTKLPAGTVVKQEERKDDCGNPITELRIEPKGGIKIILVPADE